MGKGIALQFKEKFQENYKLYKRAAEEHLIQTGSVFITPTNRVDGVKWIINFPTKKHWRHPSKMEYIESGLNDLVKQIRLFENSIHSYTTPGLWKWRIKLA
jgi:O-acetyl-ADP-ribose deacetylase (regulator of RNase III)